MKYVIYVTAVIAVIIMCILYYVKYVIYVTAVIAVIIMLYFVLCEICNLCDCCYYDCWITMRYHQCSNMWLSLKMLKSHSNLDVLTGHRTTHCPAQ